MIGTPLTGEETGLPSPFRLRTFETLDSTNAEARRAAEAGEPEALVIRADAQTGGRGRRGRAWTSELGNLYASVLLRPNEPPAEAMRLGFAAANAIAESVVELLPGGTLVQVKWPNDVLVEKKKISGILMESAAAPGGRLDWLVLGFGINLAHHPSDTPYPATDLAAEGAGDIDPDVLLAGVLRRLNAQTVMLRRVGFAAVRRAWLARAYGLDERISVHLDGTTLDGTFQALDPDGALVLRLDSGEERLISAGDVFPPR